MLFRGRSQRSLDAKGRIMLPPEFRDIVYARCAEGKLVLTSYDSCVVGYPLPDWEEFEEKFNRIKNPTRKMRDFRRLIIGSAEEVALDGQGRIKISPALCSYAGLEKETDLLGQGPKFEIWSPQRYQALTAQNFDDVTEELVESGVDLFI